MLPWNWGLARHGEERGRRYCFGSYWEVICALHAKCARKALALFASPCSALISLRNQRPFWAEFPLSGSFWREIEQARSSVCPFAVQTCLPVSDPTPSVKAPA